MPRLVSRRCTWFPGTASVLRGRWTQVPEIRYRRAMIGGVPVVTAPAEIDITTADQLRAVLIDTATRGMPRSWWT